jgi:hypothetical protein
MKISNLKRKKLLFPPVKKSNRSVLPSYNVMSFKIHESGNPKIVRRSRKTKSDQHFLFGAIESLAENKTSSKIGK